MPVKELKWPRQKGATVLEPPQSERKYTGRLICFLAATAGLALCFSLPLYHLLRLAISDDLYSEIPLIPLISAYLVWLRREKLPRVFDSAPKTAVLFFIAGSMAMAIYWLSPGHASWEIENYLAINVLAFLLFFVGVCFLFFGRNLMRVVAFPMALLIFTVPFPVALLSWIDAFLQNGSAICAGIFFQLSGMSVPRDGLLLHLSDCTLHVAPECSGIHSTLVLAIISLLGGWLFLRSPWRRAALLFAVIPLALLRNGFRIFVIGRLCVAYGPQMINSPIHRHGGPLFFVLSLIPFLLVLFFLRKTERTKPSTTEIL